MGTSSPGGGPDKSNPLIPGWIGGGGGMPPPMPPPPYPPDQPQPPVPPESDSSDDKNNAEKPNQNNTNPDRFRQPRINFNKYLRSGGQKETAAKKALRDYSRNAAGNTSQLAKRMEPSASRVVGFYDAIDSLRKNGKSNTLLQFNLAAYQNKSVSEILSALSDEIFKDTGKIYEDTQDDSITKQAYANTVVRICEQDDIDLDNLTSEQVEVMVATFIEETIAQRIICDIGNKATEIESDIEALVELEQNIYQIVKGMVRVKIMPLLQSNQRSNQNLEKNIENIYRTAFDALAGIN